MIAVQSTGKGGGAVAVDDGPRAEAGAGDGDGAVDVVDCDMLGGGDRTLLMDCDGS